MLSIRLSRCGVETFIGEITEEYGDKISDPNIYSIIHCLRANLQENWALVDAGPLSLDDWVFVRQHIEKIWRRTLNEKHSARSSILLHDFLRIQDKVEHT